MQAKTQAKKGHIKFHRFSKLVDTDGIASLLPGFPENPWLTETANLDTEHKERVIKLFAPKMPALMEIRPPHPFLERTTGKHHSRVVTDLGPWLFESVAFRICRNHSDDEIVEEFKRWLKSHSPEFKDRRKQAINLGIRGGGARRDGDLLMFLAAKRLFETQTGEKWKDVFKGIYGVFDPRQIRKAKAWLDYLFS